MIYQKHEEKLSIVIKNANSVKLLLI